MTNSIGIDRNDAIKVRDGTILCADVYHHNDRQRRGRARYRKSFLKEQFIKPGEDARRITAKQQIFHSIMHRTSIYQ
jgi:hypothetical protein